MANITEYQEKEFIRLYSSGLTARDAAQIVGISNSSSHRIRLRNKVAKHPPSDTYAAIHLWLAANFTKNKCESCGVSSSESKLDWANISGKYYRKRNDFKSLCRKCHRIFDYSRSGMCRNGLHPMSSDNIYICPRGWKNCKKCRNIASMKLKQKGVT